MWRYTTIIDVSEVPDLYRNKNATLLYLHLVLKAGYHDDDRDLVRVSVRRLAMYTGQTVAAVRHGLALLARLGLITREGERFRVRKWIPEQTIRSRTQATVEHLSPEQLERRRQRELENERRRRERDEQARGAITYEEYQAQLHAERAANERQESQAKDDAGRSPAEDEQQAVAEFRRHFGVANG